MDTRHNNIASATGCPPETALRQVLDSALVEPNASSVTAHLEHCANCQALLEQWSVDEPLRRLAGKGWGGPPSSDAASLGPLLETLRQRPSAASATNGGTVEQSAISLEFLGPPKQAGELGVLGSFRIQSILGRGGMGIVFKAYDEELQRTVAVKVLLQRLADQPELVRRFEKSVKLLGGLQHRHIVAALKAGESEGRPYLVMEYVAGVDANKYVREQGCLSVEHACVWVRQAALALEYAHGQGIVHRDIKPSNLLVDKANCIKVADLGLARLMDQRGTSKESSLTHSGAIVGTLDYLAPEQAKDARRADERSDLYSLGCTFYFLLTGQAPFAAQRGDTEKLLAHALEEPVPIQQLRPDVPPKIAELLHKLLAKKPEDRCASAQQVVNDLDSLPAEFMSQRVAKTTPWGNRFRLNASLAKLRKWFKDPARVWQAGFGSVLANVSLAIWQIVIVVLLLVRPNSSLSPELVDRRWEAIGVLVSLVVIVNLPLALLGLGTMAHRRFAILGGLVAHVFALVLVFLWLSVWPFEFGGLLHSAALRTSVLSLFTVLVGFGVFGYANALVAFLRIQNPRNTT